MNKVQRRQLQLQLKLMYLAISKEKTRMSLVVFMVAIGLSAVMTLAALSKGAQQQIALSLQQAGHRLLTLSPATLQSLPSRGGQWYRAQTLKQQDVEYIAQLPEVNVAEPIVEGSLRVKYAGGDIRTTVKGVSPVFQHLRNLAIEQGRFITQADLEQSAKVAVVGSFVRDKLNNGHSLLGQKLLINRSVYTVVGELRPKGLSSAGTNFDDLLLLPFSSANRSLFNQNYLDRVLIQYHPQVDAESLMADLSNLLRSNHNLDLMQNKTRQENTEQKDDFELLQQTQSNVAQDTADTLLGGLALFFTAVTLVAGGIGVLAVSYLNVLDRKAEIGLRMALGATRNNIATMVLLEAILLCILGGMLGTAAGTGFISLLSLATQWPLQLDWAVVVLPLCVAVILGIIFGVLPAYIASKVLPAHTLKAN